MPSPISLRNGSSKGAFSMGCVPFAAVRVNRSDMVGVGELGARELEFGEDERPRFIGKRDPRGGTADVDLALAWTGLGVLDKRMVMFTWEFGGGDVVVLESSEKVRC